MRRMGGLPVEMGRWYLGSVLVGMPFERRSEKLHPGRFRNWEGSACLERFGRSSREKESPVLEGDVLEGCKGVYCMEGPCDPRELRSFRVWKGLRLPWISRWGPALDLEGLAMRASAR